MDPSTPRTFGRRDLKELYATYNGNDDKFDLHKFDVSTRNLTTKARMQSAHHCTRCDRKMSVTCYDMPDPHYGFCPSWIHRAGKRERCGERFALWSGGCFKHLRKCGENLPFYRAAAGKPVALTEFEDPEDKDAGMESDELEDLKVQKVLAALVEEHISKHDTLPKSFYQHFYALLVQESKRTQQGTRGTHTDNETLETISLTRPQLVDSTSLSHRGALAHGGYGAKIKKRTDTIVASSFARVTKHDKRKVRHNSGTLIVNRQQEQHAFESTNSKNKPSSEEPQNDAVRVDTTEEGVEEKVKQMFDKAIQLSLI